MKLHHLFLSCASALILAFGCEDSQARKRAEVQETIKAATEQLTAAAAVRVDVDRQDQLRRDLKALITRLSNTTEGEPGQRAAATRLAGDAHRTLAAIDLSQADRLEADHRARRQVVDGMIDAVQELDAVAAIQEAIDTSTEQDELAEDRQATTAQLQEYSEQMATLDGPIADLRRQNRENRIEAERLREEASQLRREAADLGPSFGYSTFERSLQLDRQADQIEYEIARRELELRFILEPERDVADARIEQARSRIETDDGARQALEDTTQAMAAEARATRTGVADLGEQIAAALSEIEQASSGTLADLYDRAGSNLERAASQAKSASTMYRGEGTDAARVEAARAYQQLGDMYWSRARGLEQDIALRQRLTEHAELLGGVAASAGGSQSLAALHQGAVEQAIAAYRNAGDALGQVSGRTARARLEALKAKISMLQAAASGQAVDFAAAASDSPRPAGRRAAATAPGGGVGSPQALADAFRNVTDLETLTEFNHRFAHFDFQTPARQELYEAINAGNRAMLELETVLTEKFGGGLMEQLGAGQGTMGPGGLDPAALATAEISVGEVSGNRGTMTVSVGGQTQEIGLIRVNGKWYMDGTDEFNTQLSQAESMGLDQTAMLQMARAQGAAIGELTRRVRAGEFNSLQEVMMALTQGQAPQ